MGRCVRFEQGTSRVIRKRHQGPRSTDNPVLNVGHHRAEPAFQVPFARRFRSGRVEYVSCTGLRADGLVPTVRTFLVAQILWATAAPFTLGFRHGILRMHIDKGRVHVQSLQVMSDDGAIDLGRCARSHRFDAALVKDHCRIFQGFRRAHVHRCVFQRRSYQLLVHHAIDRERLLGRPTAPPDNSCGQEHPLSRTALQIFSHPLRFQHRLETAIYMTPFTFASCQFQPACMRR